MSTSISSARKRGRPAINATPVNVRLSPDELNALDRWIAENNDTLTRPAAIRAILGKATGNV